MHFIQVEVGKEAKRRRRHARKLKKMDLLVSSFDETGDESQGDSKPDMNDGEPDMRDSKWDMRDSKLDMKDSDLDRKTIRSYVGKE